MPGPRGFRHPIYGDTRRKKGGAGDCCVALKAAQEQFYKLVAQVELLIDKSVDGTYMTLEIIGQVQATASVNVRVYVRLVWRSQYNGQKFDDQNPVHIAQILDIYQVIHLGPAAPDDPLLKTPLGLEVLSKHPKYYFSQTTNSYMYLG